MIAAGLTGLAFLAGLTAGISALRGRRAEADHPPEGRFLRLDGRRVHYRQAGEGQDLILLHGASGSIREFRFGLFDALAARYRVTAIDRPGLGYSDPLPWGAQGLPAQAEWLTAVCAALGIGAPLVLGQSFGGSVGLAFALRGGARGLVLVGAPVLPWPGDLDIWYRLNRGRLGSLVMTGLASAYIWPGYVAGSLRGIFAPEPLPPAYAAGIGTGLTIRRRSLLANVAQVNGLRADLVAMEADYPRLTLPIEMVHGTEDQVVPFAVHAGPFAARHPGAHLTALEGVGHMPHHSHLPEVLAAIDRLAHRANMEHDLEVTHGPAL